MLLFFNFCEPRKIAFLHQYSCRLVIVLILLSCASLRGVSAQQPDTVGLSYIFSLERGRIGAYDGSKGRVRLFDIKGTAYHEAGSITVKGGVTAMVATPHGYVFSTGMTREDPQQPIRVYQTNANGSEARIIYEHPTERSQVNGLAWNDGKVWIDFFESKYFTKVGYLTPTINSGQAWTFNEAAHIRMGDSFDVLGKLVVVGRSYGDSQGEDGDLLLMEGDKTILLPSYRGVRSVKLFGDPKSPVIAIGDGWHSNYGQVAQARLSLLKKRPGEERYSLELIDRDTNNYSFGRLFVFSLKGKQRIAAIGNSRIEIYTESNGAWSKQNFYTQVESGYLMEAVLVDSDDQGATFAISDKGLRAARYEG